MLKKIESKIQKQTNTWNQGIQDKKQRKNI